MRRILAAVLMLMAASFASQAQTCLFTATQDATDLRLFRLAPPLGLVNNFGTSAPAAPYGVYWKTAVGTETRMEVETWGSREIRARIPAGVRVCQGAYSIILRLPRDLTAGRTADCASAPFPVVLTADRAPSGSDQACATLPPPCALVATPATARAGDWVALNTVPLGSVRAGDRVTLTCLSTGAQTSLMVTQSGTQLGVTLPARGLDCAGGQYSVQAGQCQGVLSVLPPLPLPADCAALQTAASNFFALRVAGGGPGLPVTAELVSTSGTPLQTGVTLTLPGVGGGVTVSGVQWSVSDEPGMDTLAAGGDYVSGAGSNSRRTAFTLAPQVVEGRSGVTPQPVRRFVRATLTLTVALPTGATSCTVSVSTPFNQMPLTVPRVLVLFRRKGFDAPEGGVGRDAAPGAELRRGVLVVLSPSAVDQAGRPITGLGRLVAELSRLGSALPSGSFAADSPLASAAAFALGLQDLRDRLSALTRDTSYGQAVHVGREISSLRDIRMTPGGTAAEDMFGSLMYVGPGGSGAGFFNNQKFVTDQGAFELRLGRGSFFAAVRSLDFKTDAEAAPHVTGATVRVTAPPGGPRYALIGNEIWGNDFCCHQAKSFAAELSSLRMLD